MMKQSSFYVYILTSNNNNALYIGITNDLIRRTYEHKEKIIESFTKKYNVNKLVYYEIFNDPESAIKREKQLKGGSRQKKIDLIMKENPNFLDLYDNITD